jgi:Homoserine O-succinyltransferase
LRERAMARRSEELLDSVAAVLEKSEIENTWRLTAALIYRNWLEYILARKLSAQVDHDVRFASAAGR